MNRRQRQERFEGLKRIGCIACLIEGKGIQCGEVEIHHLNVDSQQGAPRLGDEYTIGLGRWHHRGVSKPGMSRDAMTKRYGPSWAHDKEQFLSVYKSDENMLELCNIKLAQLLPALA